MAAPGEHRARAFAPLAGPDTRLLILGSLPGTASLAAREYYAHPRNGFWPLIGAVIGVEGLAARPYAERIAALEAAGVGLWDVIATAERRGSGDAEIRNPEAADLAGLVATLPRLAAIGFNGATAARHGRRQLRGETAAGLALIDLPSTSPAHAALTLAQKQAAWAPLARFIED